MKPLDEALFDAEQAALHAARFDTRDAARDAILAALHALDAAGWQCVPKEATPEMIIAGKIEMSGDVAFGFKMMLTAAPKLTGGET